MVRWCVAAIHCRDAVAAANNSLQQLAAMLGNRENNSGVFCHWQSGKGQFGAKENKVGGAQTYLEEEG